MGKVPVLYYLSGLTCTDDNFTQKGTFLPSFLPGSFFLDLSSWIFLPGSSLIFLPSFLDLPFILPSFLPKGAAYKQAAARGIAFVAPDTSPRRETPLEGEDDAYDFGSGAGFYLNATAAPWKENYHMYTYVTEELPKLINANFPINGAAQGITGHSMGGHGALTIGLKNPDKYRSVSAFSPICNPMECDWGKKAFTGYLGEDKSKWAEYDATELLKKHGPIDAHILIDQGTDDSFYPGQLLPANFEDACKEKGQKVTCRLQDGYDHSYFFISSFVDDHINHHADALLVSKV
jgi:S-formylglutathione hydrolase